MQSNLTGHDKKLKTSREIKDRFKKSLNHKLRDNLGQVKVVTHTSGFEGAIHQESKFKSIKLHQWET